MSIEIDCHQKISIDAEKVQQWRITCWVALKDETELIESGYCRLINIQKAYILRGYI